MKTTLANPKYSPAIGGHAPSEVREAFGEAVEAFLAWKSDPEPMIEFREHKLTVRQVCGLVWNCSDITPHALFAEVCDVARWPENEPKRRTYGACARVVVAAYAVKVQFAA